MAWGAILASQPCEFFSFRKLISLRIYHVTLTFYTNYQECCVCSVYDVHLFEACSLIFGGSLLSFIMDILLYCMFPFILFNVGQHCE